MEVTAQVFLKPKKEESLLRFHPWIFSGAIKGIIGNPNEGDVVEVYTSNNEFIALGHYQVGSITVRVISFEPTIIDQDFWNDKVQRAYDARQALGLTSSTTTNCYRLIHGEGDNLPGLIVDIYGETAVVQSHSVGMYLSRQNITEAIKHVYGNQIKAIYDKSEGTLPFKAGLNAKDEYLFGSSIDTPVLENRIKFNVSWEEGQKTGFFLDQRDNRELVGKYSKGRDVLNMFCYTGGFSLYALAGGANSVDSVDSSQKAMNMVDRNVEVNFGTEHKHTSYAEDAFEYLRTIDGKYDLIILDPPAFAKHTKVLNKALLGYRRLNALAFHKIKPGGILFTFSCSQVVTKEHFRNSVFTAAAISGRKVRILHQLTQPADHPINIYHPEGEYLKGLVVYVE
ncbi:class I SAM-dependent rRNA methyltransferase [Alistipes sp. ZOR0009]|uniref:class I SAM-dependent rRNA methyltransferase n=1 Tax=Alistipes sp. ZOR0009 TaxID=1339253 RepID=UPI000648AFB2|nr:class I SAM-dependent rRNA methyltransferase [Alistipes sp. ZOR0009]